MQYFLPYGKKTALFLKGAINCTVRDNSKGADSDGLEPGQKTSLDSNLPRQGLRLLGHI